MQVKFLFLCQLILESRRVMSSNNICADGYLPMGRADRPHDCVVDIWALRPPMPLNYVELDWGEDDVRREPVDLNNLRPPKKKKNPQLNVWIERSRRRRMMTDEELAENSDLFEAINRERRTGKIELILICLIMLLLFFLFLSFFYVGLIPFCNL